jgi:hypothetical protein
MEDESDWSAGTVLEARNADARKPVGLNRGLDWVKKLDGFIAWLLANPWKANSIGAPAQFLGP